MRAMQRRCELLMELKPGPPAYGEANPDPLRCCERETWLFSDHTLDRASLCTITLRKRARRGEPCPGQIAASDADPRRNAEQSGGSRALPREERRKPMRVVRVLAPGPDGEGEEIGTAETVIEARRIAESVGWCRAYRSYIDGPNVVYDCLSVQLNYTWDRERDRWVSDDSGGYGEPSTVRLSNARGGAPRPSIGYFHRIAELSESPLRCARCDAILQPGADSWRSYDRGREPDVFCHDCARPPIWWDPEPRGRTPPREASGLPKGKRIRQTAGANADGTTWISPDDPLFGATHHVQDTVSLADSPLRCVRCGGILQPGTHFWRTYNEERDFGTACWDCEGAPGYLSGVPEPKPTA